MQQLVTRYRYAVVRYLFALAFFVSAQAQAETSTDAIAYSDPFLMMQEVATKTFDRIKMERESIDMNEAVLKTIIEEELIPYIDYRYTTFKVLGRNLNKFKTREELREFVSIFKSYLVATYAVVLSNYQDQVVTFEPARDLGDSTDVTIKAVIENEDGPDVNIAFKVRKNKDTGYWSTWDIIAEGISLVSSKQSEFSSIIRRESIDAVVALMQETIEEDA